MSNEQLTKIWVSRYALSKGVYEADAVVINSGMAKVPNACGGHYLHGNDFHLTRERAIARAKDMQEKKIAALEKQLKKLKSWSFA